MTSRIIKNIPYSGNCNDNVGLISLASMDPSTFLNVHVKPRGEDSYKDSAHLCMHVDAAKKLRDELLDIYPIFSGVAYTDTDTGRAARVRNAVIELVDAIRSAKSAGLSVDLDDCYLDDAIETGCENDVRRSVRIQRDL